MDIISHIFVSKNLFDFGYILQQTKTIINSITYVTAQRISPLTDFVFKNPVTEYIEYIMVIIADSQ